MLINCGDAIHKINMQEEFGQWLPQSQDVVNLCFSGSFISSQIDSSIEPQTRNSGPESTEKESVNSLVADNDAGPAEGIDLNRKPVQKPKRKKHRPKVIKEVTSAKPQKSTTPKPPKEKGDQPSGKRKYVRRKGLNTPTKQPSTEDADTHNIVDPNSARQYLSFDGEDLQENVHLVGSRAQVTEIPTGPRNSQPSMSVGQRGADVQVPCHLGATTTSICGSADPMDKVQKLHTYYVPNGVTFDLNSSINQVHSACANLMDSSGQFFQSGTRETVNTNQLLDFCAGTLDKSVPDLNSSVNQVQNGSTDLHQCLLASQTSREKTPTADQMFHGYVMPEDPITALHHIERASVMGNLNPKTCTREAVIANQTLQGYRIPESPIALPNCTERDSLRGNLNELATNHDYLKFATNPNNRIGDALGLHDTFNFSDVLPIGKKREHSAVGGPHISLGMNFDHPNIARLFCNDSHSTSSQTSYFPENYKKMRSEDHRNRLNGVAGSFSSSSSYLPSNWNVNGISAVNSGVCTLADVQRLLDFQKSRASQGMFGLGMSENSMVNKPNMVQHHIKPTLLDTTGKDCIASPDKQLYMTAEHVQLPSSTMNPSRENSIQSNGSHQFQSLENSLVKGLDFLGELHSTSPRHDTVNKYCIATPDKQIRGNNAELVSTPVPPINPPTNNKILIIENSQLEVSRENTAAKPSEKPKVRGRPRKEANSNEKPKVRGRPRKERIGLQKLTSSKGSRTNLLKNEGISCVSECSAGTTPGVTTAQSERNKERASCILTASDHDNYSSVSSKQTHAESISEVIAPLVNLLDGVIQKLKSLDINKSNEIVVAEPQNALVPYKGELGAMVPFEGKVKKRRSRAKVNLDPVTTLMWKLLMGPDVSDEAEGMDENKEKWLDEERRIFRGRIDSFIARMHLVQGDRRFSPWKGSVVDSVVGVFLTQNVSDHLSSSAFMALAAKFPAKSETPEKPAEGMSHKPPGWNASCSGPFGAANNLRGKFFIEEISGIGSLVTTEENEGSNSNELFGSASGDGVDCSAGVHSNSYSKSLIGLNKNGPPSTIVTEIGTAGVIEAEDGPLEDVVSSQNSAVSCQSSPDYLFHPTDHMGSSLMPNFASEDFIVRNRSRSMGSSTTYTEVLLMQDQHSKSNEKIGLSEYSGVNLLQVPGVDKGVLHSLNNGYHPIHTSASYLQNGQVDFRGAPYDKHVDKSFYTSLDGVNDSNVTQSESCFHHLPSTTILADKNKTTMTDSLSSFLYCIDEPLSQEKSPFPPEPSQDADLFSPIIKQYFQPTSSQIVTFSRERSFSEKSLSRNTNEAPFVKQHENSNLQEECTTRMEQIGGQKFQSGCSKHDSDARVQRMTCEKHDSSNLHENQKADSEVLRGVTSNLMEKSKDAQESPLEIPIDGPKAKKVRAGAAKKKAYDWDSLRKEVFCNGGVKQRGHNAKDTIDWEAVRQADVREISEAIKERGMNNMLAERIKDFLNRLVRDHGSIDLEWLRDVQPDKAKDYLLSIRGLGLKSVECIRLLTLHHMAFPVDTNVGRICVRLGWVPLQPLPESLQLHLLELYPMLENIQKYLWPRLCKLDQLTLYELHYQMITFGKVFCSKNKPNCNSCPMRAECKHFASAFASARLALPGPEEKGLVMSGTPIAAESCHQTYINSRPVDQFEWNAHSREHAGFSDRQPIIEEPPSPEPEPERAEIKEGAIEDLFVEDPDEIPSIKLNFEEFTQNLKSYMQANNIEIEDADMSMALVAINPEAASIPTPKLKNVSRLRTEHQVYELPDSHPLLEGFDQRQPDDPCPYLLSIWTPGETAQSTDAPKTFCNSQENGELCETLTCFSCNSIREVQAQKVRGTLLIPCRTAMRGSFPLNGTYFQVNEVFADHHTSQHPIDVPRDWIWRLPRRTVYFGTSIPTIFRGLTTEEIQHCFWRGFVCVRGFDRTSRAPRPLYPRLHFPASRVTRNKKSAASAAARDEQ